MTTTKKRIVNVKESESTTVEIELDQHFLDFYKKETGKTKVTQKGLTKFINHLIEIHQS